MTTSTRWFDRKFELGIPPEALPPIIERLRGTPARMEERLKEVPHERLVSKPNGKWSIQEQAGHLLDLEELWFGRFEDFRNGLRELRPADLQNTKTNQANHNASELAAILREFRAARLIFVNAIEQVDNALITRTSLHPRLKRPMSITDHAFFVAEHDDHHLAVITALLR